MKSTTGIPLTTTIPCTIYAPQCPTCLIYPQHLLAVAGSPMDPVTNLPNIMTFHTLIPICLQATSSSTVPKQAPMDPMENTPICNVTPAQQVKFKWHYRMNHLNFAPICRKHGEPNMHGLPIWQSTSASP